MRKIFIVLVLSLILCGCSDNSNDNFKEIMSKEEYIIVDVRTKEEYETSHVVDAINIPYDEISDSIELDKNKNIFVYCKSGNRSQIAFNELKNLGYNVYDLGAFDEIDLPKK